MKKRARAGFQHEPLNFTSSAKDDYVAGFGASAGGAGALVAAGVGDEVAGAIIAGAALQPLVQPVPQLLQPPVAQAAGAAQQGAGAAQVAPQVGAAQHRGWQQRVRQQRCLQQRASAVETDNRTAAAANIQNNRLISISFNNERVSDREDRRPSTPLFRPGPK